MCLFGIHQVERDGERMSFFFLFLYSPFIVTFCYTSPPQEIARENNSLTMITKIVFGDGYRTNAPLGPDSFYSSERAPHIDIYGSASPVTTHTSISPPVRNNNKRQQSCLSTILESSDLSTQHGENCFTSTSSSSIQISKGKDTLVPPPMTSLFGTRVNMTDRFTPVDFDEHGMI